MKTILVTFLIALLAASKVHSDGHEKKQSASAPFNMQVNVCTLKPKKTMSDYEKVFNAYVDWAKANEVDVYNARQMPLMTHADIQNPDTYEFLDIMVSSYERQGKGWDLWLTTKEGQKLNAQWQSVADCYVKMASGVLLHSTEALDTDDERVVTWNWCNAKPGVGIEQLMAKHLQIASTIPAESPLMAWATIVPNVGTARAPGEFAHIVAYADMKAYMSLREYRAKGGWRDLRDYYASYADCSGEALNTETVIHRPSL